ncbi:hypothetical protein BH24ACT22_BH24ACT22_05160 [soil metagenome]
MIKRSTIDIMEFERPTRNSARARRAYSATPEELTSAVERAVENLPRWTLESSTDGELIATRKTGLLRFTDDVTIRILSRGSTSEAHFESASRVGKGDLGQNPRNLEELLEAINRKLD